MDTFYYYLLTFIIGLATGVLSTYTANRLIAKAKQKDKKKEIIKTYKNLKSKMPELINEMKHDIRSQGTKTCREFFVSSNKAFTINTRNPAFMYYENEHEDLLSKLRVLENEGFIIDITPSNAPKYQFTEQFIDLLNDDK
jgi:hypothetical protein